MRTARTACALVQVVMAVLAGRTQSGDPSDVNRLGRQRDEGEKEGGRVVKQGKCHPDMAFGC